MPDSLVGTDSHTTMINGLGVVGWGVGGIEAEAVMLGQPLYMLLPEVVGFELTGELPPGATATDLVLTVTQILRKAGVVDKFVEFFGAGRLRHVAGRPGDDRQHGPRVRRDDGLLPRRCRNAQLPAPHGPHRGTKCELVERYCKEQGLFRTDDGPTPIFTKTLALDLGTVEPSLAGPKRPQDRVPLADDEAIVAARRWPRRWPSAASPSTMRRPRSASAVLDNGHSSRDQRTAPSSSPRSRAAPTPATRRS